MFVGRDTFVSKALSPAQHVVGDRPGALKFPCTCLSWAITWRLSFHLGHPEHQWVSGCSVWSLDVTSTSRPLVVLWELVQLTQLSRPLLLQCLPEAGVVPGCNPYNSSFPIAVDLSFSCIYRRNKQEVSASVCVQQWDDVSVWVSWLIWVLVGQLSHFSS